MDLRKSIDSQRDPDPVSCPQRNLSQRDPKECPVSLEPFRVLYTPLGLSVVIEMDKLGMPPVPKLLLDGVVGRIAATTSKTSSVNLTILKTHIATLNYVK
jgi:hypothetical protein